MNTTDDLELRLRDWMTAAATSAPDAPVQRALGSIPQVRQRPGLLATTGLGTAGWAPVRWSAARFILVGLLIVALVGAAVMVASRRPDEPRPRPSGPPPSAALPSVPLKLTLKDVWTIGFRDPFGPGVQGRVALDDPALVRLSDDRVLVLGGSSNATGSTQSVATAGIYDPERREMIATGSMNVARTGATAVTLEDGRVLVLGGHEVTSAGAGRSITEAEIFDPTTGLFTSVDPLLTSRDPCHCGVRFQVLVGMHTSLMGDGRVFIAGGSQAGVAGTSVADIFDPVSGTFERVEIGCDASRGTQTALPDGRVLVLCAEGGSSGPSTTARIFDPALDQFITPAQPAGGSAGLATLLADGRVLVTGAVLQDVKAPAELFDPSTNTWRALDPAINPFVGAAGALMDGRVAFLDGDDTKSVIFDPSANAFVPAPRIPLMVASPPVWLSANRLLFLSGTRSNLYLYEMEPGQ
jgi:hypothetical protein